MGKNFSARSAVSVLIVVAVALCVCSTATAAGRPITVTDLLSLHRVSDPQVSPDGARVLYTVGVPDVPANRTARDIWLVTVATGEAKALTSGGHESDGRWSPDGRRVAFISSRAGNQQLFVMNADGSDAKAVSTLSGGVANIVWAPDGRSIAFSALTGGWTDLFVTDVATGALRQLTDELANFPDIARPLLPQAGELPRLPGIDVSRAEILLPVRHCLLAKRGTTLAGVKRVVAHPQAPPPERSTTRARHW